MAPAADPPSAAQKPVDPALGELEIPEVTLHSAAALACIRAAVREDPGAQALAAALRARVAAEPGPTEPQPLERIDYEGHLPTHPNRIATVRSLHDMRRLAERYQAWVATGDAGLVEPMRQVILAWVRTHRSNGNPVNENKLEPLLVAAAQLREAGLGAETWAALQVWTREVQRRHAGKAIERTNWGSKRLKILLLCALILDDAAWIDRVTGEVRAYVDEALYPDGSSEDLRERDALAYHVSGLKGILQVLALLPEDRAQALWAYTGARGGSIEASVRFVLPYARGERVYAQWENSRVPLDRARAEAGLAYYQPGSLFEAERALPLLAWSSPYLAEAAQSIEATTADADVGAHSQTRWRALTLACR